MGEGTIPSFSRPPVVEVIWSVQFAPLSWLTAAHMGLFWAKVKDDFPLCEEHPPIERAREPHNVLDFPAERRFVAVARRLPLPRQWFISEADTELIQLQEDRFCLNWRESSEDDKYPRYEHMRVQFQRRWQEFCELTLEQGGEIPQVDLLEMTYVNHVYRGQGWREPCEIGDVIPMISFSKDEGGFLPPPASLGCRFVFDIAQENGRLHVSCQHAKMRRGTDGDVSTEKELLRLDLVARGHPEGTDAESLMVWFERAREWIVRGFADLTTLNMQTQEWGREQ